MVVQQGYQGYEQECTQIHGTRGVSRDRCKIAFHTRDDRSYSDFFPTMDASDEQNKVLRKTKVGRKGRERDGIEG